MEQSFYWWAGFNVLAFIFIALSLATLASMLFNKDKTQSGTIE